MRDVREERRGQPCGNQRLVTPGHVQPAPQAAQRAAGDWIGDRAVQRDPLEKDRHRLLDAPAGRGDPHCAASLVTEIKPDRAAGAGSPEVKPGLVLLLGDALDDHQRVGKCLLRCGPAGTSEVIAGQLAPQRRPPAAQHQRDTRAGLRHSERLAAVAKTELVPLTGDLH